MVLLTDKIEKFLRQDAGLHLCELGDLNDFFSHFTTWYGHEDRGKINSLALLYTGTELPVLLAMAEPGSVSIRKKAGGVAVGFHRPAPAGRSGRAGDLPGGPARLRQRRRRRGQGFVRTASGSWRRAGCSWSTTRSGTASNGWKSSRPKAGWSG